MAWLICSSVTIATILLCILQCTATPTSRSEFRAYGCATSLPRQQHGYLVLDAGHSSPKDGYCRALVDETIYGTNYDLQVELYNYIGWNGVNSGHPGVAYNVIDENNFDVFYVRPHYAKGCFQTGYVRNGVVSWGQSSACADGPPAGRTWFHVYVAVRDSSAAIYVNNVLVVKVTPHFRATGRGGVLAYRGYSNVAYFKNFEITGHMFETSNISDFN